MTDAGAPKGSYSTPAPAIDTSNKYMVARQGDKILILRSGPLGSPMTEEQAITLAAWLVAMALEPGTDARFAAVLRAIRNT